MEDSRHPARTLPPHGRVREVGPWIDVAAIALTTWMGVHALRTFWSVIVWNVGEDRSPTQLGLLALAFWVIGLLAWPVKQRLGGDRPAWRFVGLFAVVYAVTAFVTHPALAAAFGIAGAVAWLWLLPAVIVAVAGRGADGAVFPGFLVGLAAQVTLQTALHGLDLPALRGIGPGLGAVTLAAALMMAIRLGSGPAARSDDARAAARSATTGPPGTLPGWGLVSLGPYLLLQLTLLANPGRIQLLADWDLLTASGFIVLSLAVGAAASGLALPSVARGAAGLVAVVLLIRPAWLSGTGVWWLVLVQAALAVAVWPALSGAQGRRHDGVYGGVVLAALAYFVLTFLYYSRWGWTAVWPVMAALAVLPGLVVQRDLSPDVPGGAVSLAGMTVAVAVLVGLATAAEPPASQAAGPAPAELKVLTYNIHEAFSGYSVPEPEAVARVIERSNADLIGLQEVARGWNINGGPDLVAWLRWRFPQYSVVYAPMLGDMVGDVILSRHPIADSGYRWYPKRAHRFHYGLMWARIATTRGTVLFVNTHFSPYAGYDADRTAQAGDLLAFWQRRPRTIIVGDFNVVAPGDRPVQRLLAGGLVDTSAPFGLGTAPTHSSVALSERRDFIFVSPDITPLRAAIRQTTASDHLPVEARVLVR